MADEEIDAVDGAIGWGFATWAVAVETLNALTRKGILTPAEAHDVIARAKVMIHRPDGLPGGPDAIQVARDCLTLVGEVFQAATAAPPPSGGKH